jgi:type IV pilus assembly protein PilA
MNTIKNNKGFSLIELMIAVVIIGILAAIAIPNYQKFQRKSRQAEAKATLAGMYTSEKTFVAEYGGPTDDLGAMGFAAEGRIVYRCGFAAAATYPPRYPATAARPGIGDTANAAICGTAGALINDCNADGLTDFGVDPGAIAAGVVGVSPATTFTIECRGNIGGAATDTWTIDNAKELVMTADGTT